MPIGFTIKRTAAYTLILCVLIVFMCLGCKSGEELDSPVEVSTQSKPPVSSQTAVPFPTLVPLTSTIPIVSKEESLSTVEVVKLLKPSVVHIASGSVSMDIFNQPVPRTGVGSGLVLDSEGRILTNNHVISSAQSVTATLGDGRSYSASLVGSDPVTDLAVIQIDAAQLVPARLGNSSKIEVGENVIAVGHALGLKGGPTVSKGVVSAVNRTIAVNSQSSMVDLIQTDASINPGNSGGPLVNMQGEVIGINTAIINGSNGIGFAINIDDAKTIVAQLIEFGVVNRGFIGISPFDVTDSIRDKINLPVAEGVIIAGIVLGYPADLSGLEVEDVIIKLDEVNISNSGDLSKYLINHPPGSEVVVTFYRDGSLDMVELTLASAR
tara:strand:- start:3233 stop:4375 length:1143 start_codon:yes stop_codon:yes gene_type:complete